MSSDVLAAVIGGAIGATAALVSTALTAYFALRGVWATIQSDRERLLTEIAQDRKNLATQLAHDSALSRESLLQQRIERAYIKIIAYENLVGYFNLINHRVYQREMNAAKKIRDRDGFFDAGSPEGKAALEEAGPTEEELRVLQSGPTMGDHAEMLALIECLASDEVRTKFDELHKIVSQLNDQMIEGRVALRREPRPSDSSAVDESDARAGSGEEASDATDDERRRIQANKRIQAARNALKRVGEQPTMGILQAAVSFEPKKNELIKLIRTELASANPNINPSASSIGDVPPTLS